MKEGKLFHVEGSGNVSMVERWCIVHERTRTIPYPRSVDWTVDSFEEGEERIAAIKRNNREKDFLEHYPGGLTLAKWWCYPRSNYPFESVETFPIWIVIDLTAQERSRLYDENGPNMLKNWRETIGYPSIEQGEERFNFDVEILKKHNEELFGQKCHYIVLPTISAKERDAIRAKLVMEMEMKKNEKARKILKAEYRRRKSLGLDTSDLS
jgi:hypothetical protein